ncbi:hypothetical protein FQR65_LT03325 [Abscondita terminalis]|nr:hypothetical protein FQR65_LT03325 [Abscondita terminalis]
MNSSFFALILLLCPVDLVFSNTPTRTTTEVPLYMRQSWFKMSDSILSACICESGANPTKVFKSIMNTEVASDPCLKCCYKCFATKLNFVDASTGEFHEKEMLRQIEGLTPEIFKKCNDEVKDEIDICEKVFGMYMCHVHSVSKPKSLLKYVPSQKTSTAVSYKDLFI